ncbi:MAG: hypothetical protein CSB49_06330 [Proteobacteria bacterium]|nr:MAG: hypothetical protein CSB49_06330 [Pseudomonadota bacterium]
MLGLAVVAGGCSDDGGATAKAGFGDCTKDRPDWRQCSEGKIQVCHVVSGMDPHFHWGADCKSLGLSCVNINKQGKAACVDETKTCATADEKCEGNTAYFCVDGKLGQEPCGTAATCHVEAGEAPHCEAASEACGGHGHLHDGACRCDTGYKVDPADKANCVADKAFTEIACDEFAVTPKSETVVEVFASFEDVHVDLDTPYEVTLPDDKPSYLHFSVTETGEYVIFLSEAGVFDTFMHRNETEVAPAGGVANGKCATAIRDHWHADLTFDGAPGDTKVPYIVRFKAVAGGKTVTLMIKHHDAHD